MGWNECNGERRAGGREMQGAGLADCCGEQESGRAGGCRGGWRGRRAGGQGAPTCLPCRLYGQRAMPNRRHTRFRMVSPTLHQCMCVAGTGRACRLPVSGCGAGSMRRLGASAAGCAACCAALRCAALPCCPLTPGAGMLARMAAWGSTHHSKTCISHFSLASWLKKRRQTAGGKRRGEAAGGGGEPRAGPMAHTPCGIGSAAPPG